MASAVGTPPVTDRPAVDSPLSPSTSDSVLSPLILSELPPVVRLDGDAFVYIGKPGSMGITPGATSSVGIFAHNGKRYYGKGVVMDDQPYALREALKEVFANSMYRHFGCHAQQLILSVQKWLPGSESFSRDVMVPSGIHLMTEWIDGFTPFGSFVTQQLLSSVWPPLSDMFIVGQKRVLPVRGLGQIVAVGMLVNDTDCIAALVAQEATWATPSSLIPTPTRPCMRKPSKSIPACPSNTCGGWTCNPRLGTTSSCQTRWPK